MEIAEEQFQKEFELRFEFTAIFAYSKGASLNDHYDSTRNYLQNRHYSAVLYLSDGGGKDFAGGDFVFRDSLPETDLMRVVPQKGGLLLFTSGIENIHRVEEVTNGTRYALNMFFTRNPDACEDQKHLNFIPLDYTLNFQLPNGEDSELSCNEVEIAQIQQLKENQIENPNSKHLKENLKNLNIEFVSGFTFYSEPLMIKIDEEVIPQVFDNIMDALHFGSFYKWQSKQNPCQSNQNLLTLFMGYRAKLLLSTIQSIPIWKRNGLITFCESTQESNRVESNTEESNQPVLKKQKVS